MSSIEAWLDERGLGKYAGAFVANEIEVEDLPHLSEADLRELGLPLGPRRRIQRAIAAGAPAREPPAPAPADSDPEPSRGPGAEPERRQLTVMFCDLVGSTALSERLDPEAYRDLLAAYQSAAARAIEHYEGYVARYMGDGVLAYFGYPRAHEEDAERAVRSALDVVAAVRALARDGEAGLEVRIGIATGVAVAGDIVGEGASQERAVLGETPNLGARLQAAAAGNTVLISQTTQRLVERAFETERCAPLRLKGITAPVTAYRVLSAKAVQSRSEALRSARLTPLAGREGELALIAGRWQQAKAGAGQALLISAEPGVGKSRLVHEVRERLRGEPLHLVSLYCSPYHAGSALYPVVEALGAALALGRDESPPAKLDKVEAWLDGLDLAGDAERVALLAALLAIPLEGRYPALALPPAELRRRTLDTLVRIIAGLARERPLLLIAEDLHWCDPSTLELLGLVLDWMHDARALALLTFRPEFAAPWGRRPHLTAFAINHLTSEECRRLVRAVVAGAAALEDHVLEQIVARTDGVPLFAEELARTVLEAVGSAASEIHVPTTLRDALTARLDRLGPARSVAQTASIIGREFSRALLAAVCEEPGLDGALERLVASELVARVGEHPEARFRFKHALVQETAYESLLGSQRRAGHRRVAAAIERDPDTDPVLLAHHYTQAGEIERALGYRRVAGEAAVRGNALKEAEDNLEAALDLLSGRPGDPESGTERMGLLMLLGPVRANLHGFGSAKVFATYTEARALAGRLGDVARGFEAAWGLWFNEQMRGNLDVARRLLCEVEERARGTAEPEHVLQAHHASWTTMFSLGDLGACYDHTVAGAALYSAERHGAHALRYAGHDPGVCGAAHGALASWMLGYPDRARELCAGALALARRLDHQASIGLAQYFGAWVAQFRREPEAVEALARSFPGAAAHHRAAMAVCHGWALVALGSGAAGLRECEEGVARFKGLGTTLRLSLLEYALADAYLILARTSEALACVDAAIAHLGDRSIEAELLRLKGEIVLRQRGPDVALAEHLFARALAVARGQGARSWELRAAASLARLERDHGARPDAGALLAPVYAGFTEGLATPDLEAARALLDALGQAG